MYCKNCGHQVDEKAVICTQCGCLTDAGEKLNLNQLSQNQPTQEASQSASNSNKTLGTIAKVLMILSCVFSGFYLIPLCWTIPSYMNPRISVVYLPLNTNL